MVRRMGPVAKILAFVTLGLAGSSAGAADLTTGSVTPGAALVPLGATCPLSVAGHFTDGSTRRLSHATLAVGSNHACVLEPNGEVRCWGRGGSGQLGSGVAADLARSDRGPERRGDGELGQLGNGSSGFGYVEDTPVAMNGVNMDAAALTWISADPTIATVDMSGRVHGVGVGSTMLLWKYDSRSGFVPIEVPEPGLLAGVFAGALGLVPLARRRVGSAWKERRVHPERRPRR